MGTRNVRAHFQSGCNGTLIWAIDADDGAASITNDAEAVTEFLVAAYGDKPIIYRDTEGRWDFLAHRGGRFTGFAVFNFEGDVASALAAAESFL